MTQEEAFEILKTGQNCFITGSAGSGKTYLVNAYIEYLREHNVSVAITASTGIAATHLGGITIHSWSGIGTKDYLTEYLLDDITSREYLVKRFKKNKVLIIDEVSMLKKGQLDMVNVILQSALHNSKPFGGLQVILVGDFFQLPPVVRRSFSAVDEDSETTEIDFEEYIEDGERLRKNSEFIFASNAWRQADFTILYLSTQFRQQDDQFLNILNAIRSDQVEEEHKIPLRKRWKQAVESDEEPTRLFTHNIDVEKINNEFLQQLSGKMVEYQMTDEKGGEKILENLRKNCLAPERLQLKVGAKVMCVKNNFEEGYVNGTIAWVESCSPGKAPTIRTSQGKILTVEKADWVVEEDGRVLAKISQYPLRLAWAITVHKSQGMSLDSAEIDLSKTFEKGMGYVALSRVRTLGGLSLTGINETAFQVNEEVLSFDKKLRQKSALTAQVLRETDKKTLKKIQDAFLAIVSDTKAQAKKLSTYDKTMLDLAAKKSLTQIAKDRGLTEETIISHIETLLKQGEVPYLRYLLSNMSAGKIKKISSAIEQVAKGNKEQRVLLSPIKQKLGSLATFLEIRLVRVVLEQEVKKEGKN